MRRLREYLPRMVLVASICLLLAGCARRQATITPPPAPTAPTKSTSVVFEGYSFVFPPDQQPRVWEIKTRRGTGSTEDGRLALEGVECTLYRQGKPALRVTAKTGTADVQGKTARLSLAGQVKAVELTRKLVLHAASFTWTSAEGRIHVTKLRWQGEGLAHAADSGSFSTDLTEGTFQGHVTTTSAGNAGLK
jgi:hypothetical protein